ncbi:MAG: NlpC/P60 family protein [Candidatus Eisenbacteria bacterium]|nr:NlpC/P60 family protein [Candidatus Eisenbacteria bacterium]
MKEWLKKGIFISKTFDINWTGHDRMEDEMKKRAEVVDFAVKQLGKPYKFGVENKKGSDSPYSVAFDCSELSEHCYASTSLEMPDGANAQMGFCRLVKEPLPGDLGFLINDAGKADHVEIYIGSNEIIGAVGGSVGKVRKTSWDYIRDHARFGCWARHPSFSMRPYKEA